MRYTHDEMLPERAFQPRAKGPFGHCLGMTLEGKGGSASAPAADPNIGIAQKELADISREYLNSWKTDVWPAMQQQMQKQETRADEQFALDRATQEKQNAMADEAMSRYRQYGYPIQESLFNEAKDAGGAADQERYAQQALGDYRLAADQSRQGLQMQMQSYGIDPTSGRYQGGISAQATNDAALEAAASNRARMAAQQLGWAKKMDTAALAQGQFGNQTTSTTLGLSAGNQALNSGQLGMSNLGMAGNSMSQAYGGAMSGWNSVGNLGVNKYNADVNVYKAQTAADSQSSAGFGNMVGSIGAAAVTAF